MSGFRRDILGDAYTIEEESDEERIESSDEELDKILHDRKKLSKRCRDPRKSSSEDEFEKEMSAELSKTLKHIHSTAQNTSTAATAAVPMIASAAAAPDIPPASDGTKKPSKRRARNTDEIYFGSDSDDNEDIKDSGPILSNDDLLYDPEMDNADQDWVDNQRRDYLGNQYRRRGRKPKSKEQAPEKVKALPHSDAILNCPACMTLLTLDCQRHVKHQHQYRAMFVSNCVVDTSEKLCFQVNDTPQPSARSKKKNKTKKNKNKSRGSQANESDHGRKFCDDASMTVDSGDTGMDVSNSCCTQGDAALLSENGAGAAGEPDVAIGGDSAEMYNQVKWVECNTVVGVYDCDEVYHFFNVLSSHS